MGVLKSMFYAVALDLPLKTGGLSEVKKQVEAASRILAISEDGHASRFFTASKSQAAALPCSASQPRFALLAEAVDLITASR